MRLSALIFSSLFAAMMLTNPARAAAPAVARVWTSYRTAESFARIREYFNGGEQPGGETILRTRASERTGYYFLVRLESAEASTPGVRFELSVVLPGSPEPRTFEFRTNATGGDRVFNLGVTGVDWPGSSVRPVAWRLIVQNAAGAEVAGAQSFLWSLPPARN